VFFRSVFLYGFCRCFSSELLFDFGMLSDVATKEFLFFCMDSWVFVSDCFLNGFWCFFHRKCCLFLHGF